MRMRPTHQELVIIPSMMTQRQITSLKDYSTLLCHIHSFAFLSFCLLSLDVVDSCSLLCIMCSLIIIIFNIIIMVYADNRQ